MWWDVFPCVGEPENEEFIDRDREIVNIMEKTLELDHTACQESALHGLGHWQISYPERSNKVAR